MVRVGTSDTTPSVRTATEPTFLETLVSSALGGAIGGFICFPFEGLKKRLQSHQLIVYSPRELFRGAPSFSVSVTAATVGCMFFNRLLHSLPSYDPSSSLSQAISAVASGALGAFVGSTPVENTILRQQLEKLGPLSAIRSLFREGITRPWLGLRELAMREAGFAGAMLWAVPAARDEVYEKTKSISLAGVAEVGVGILGALLTHPFDTVATTRQHSNGRYSIAETVRRLYETAGIGAFYRGGANRCVLFTGCALIIPEVQKRVLDALRYKRESLTPREVSSLRRTVPK